MKKFTHLLVLILTMVLTSGCTDDASKSDKRTKRDQEKKSKSASNNPVVQPMRYRTKEKPATPVSQKGVNVVWFLIDALRADHLGCYGYEKDTSPFIDRFARESVLFKNAMSQESYTQASVPSYFTSTYPTVHQVLYDNPEIDTLADEFTTIAEVLSAEGYTTAAFVFNPHLKAKYGFGQGFDIYDDNAPGWPENVPLYERFETARKLHEKTAQFLTENKRRPLFLYLHYRDVHTPYVPPPPFHSTFLPTGEKARIDLLYPKGNKHKPISMRKNLALHISQYDGEIRYTDAYIEQTVALLSQNGVNRENTIFIITSDHGEEFYDEHPGDKGGKSHGRTLYREQIHVPLIIAVPGLEPAKRIIESPVELVDIVPTILDHVGVDWRVFEQFSGTSLREMMTTGAETRRRVYSGGSHRRGMVIESGWKFYRNDKKLKKRRSRNFRQPKENQRYNMVEELYHIEQDPLEKNNLLDKAPDRANELRQKLDALEKELNEKRTSGQKQILSEETKQKLKALGYIE